MPLFLSAETHPLSFQEPYVRYTAGERGLQQDDCILHFGATSRAKQPDSTVISGGTYADDAQVLILRVIGTVTLCALQPRRLFTSN